MGLIFAIKYAAKTYIDPNPEITEAEIEVRLQEAPGALKSVLPVLVPIILIVLKSILSYLGESVNGNLVKFISFIGEPVIALLIGMFLALALPKKLKSDMLAAAGWVGQSLTSAASIILITGSGGIFGKVLQNSGIADLLGKTLADINLSIWLPFLLAAAIKTAQGFLFLFHLAFV